MQKVRTRRRARKQTLMRRVLAICLAGLLVTLIVWYMIPKDTVQIPANDKSGTIMVREAAELCRIEAAHKDGLSWQIQCLDDGTMVVEETGTMVDTAVADLLRHAACYIDYQLLLSDEPSEFMKNIAEFGLDIPEVAVTYIYSDESRITISYGAKVPSEDGLVYMMVDGDGSLYAADAGTMDTLRLKAEEMESFSQPVLHKSRIDRIVMKGANDILQAEWMLHGMVTDGDAADKWYVEYPFVYPADGEALSKLRSNIANLRLGAYVGEANEDNKIRYGLDTPCFQMSIHMAAGSIGNPDVNGVYQIVDYPEEEIVLYVGAAKNEVMDYVMVGDGIYLTNHFSLQSLMNAEPIRTVTRYPLQTALGNLAKMQIETAGHADTYIIQREEQTDDEGNVLLDEGGSTAYTISCLKNNESIEYSAFETAYNNLLITTVSGELPTDWAPVDECHTRMTFEHVNGVNHVIELFTFDALHDAVYVDGYALFYLPKERLAFSV